MAFSDSTKDNFAFKAILGKAHTSNSREISNEILLSGVTSSATRVWSQAIPVSGANAISIGVATKVTGLILEAISGAVISGIQTAYRLKLAGSVPSGLIGKINPLTNVAYASNDYIGSIIPEAYGVTGSSDYRPILYGNGIEITPLDAADWFLDPFSGILTREADTDSLNAWALPLTMDAYVYVGEFVNQTLQNLQTYANNISGAYISRVEVAAISAGLNTNIIYNSNDINTLYSTYANSSTVADISSGLNTNIIYNSNDINTLYSTYANSSTVEAISSGLNTSVVQISGYTQQNTNDINTLYSTYANSATVASISAGIVDIFTKDIINLDQDLQGQIHINTNKINTLYSTYANSATVEAISAGLNTAVVQISGYVQNNTLQVGYQGNSINTLYSTYANSVTVEAISAGIVNTFTNDIINLDTDIQLQINRNNNRINTLYSTYANSTTVAAISAGLNTAVVQISGYVQNNTLQVGYQGNSINTLYSTYANSATVEAISAGLMFIHNTDIINLDTDIQLQINRNNNRINTLYSTYANSTTVAAISSGLQTQITNTTSWQGTLALNTTNLAYTISHASLTSLSSRYPIISLQIPTSASNLMLAAITNRSLSTFDVVLSQIPNITGYYINWILGG